MNTTTIISKLSTIQNGSWFNVKLMSPVPLSAKGKKDGVVIYKISEMQCRKGIEYKNQKVVKAKVEAGKVLTHELPWGNWIKGHEGLLIEHKGLNYVRLYLGANKPKVSYELIFAKNGKVMKLALTKEQLLKAGWVTKSWAEKKSERPDAMTVRVDNIVSLG